MSRYIDGLIKVCDDISDDVFTALSKNTEDMEFSKEIIENELNNEYNQSLDWLYSLIPTK